MVRPPPSLLSHDHDLINLHRNVGCIVTIEPPQLSSTETAGVVVSLIYCGGVTLA